MQPTKDEAAIDHSLVRGVNFPSVGGFLSQALMGPVMVVILKKLPDDSAGMPFIENDHVVETHMEMHNAPAIQRQYDEHIRSGV